MDTDQGIINTESCYNSSQQYSSRQRSPKNGKPMVISPKCNGDIDLFVLSEKPSSHEAASSYRRSTSRR